ncbi:MAG: DUF2282 domain-containing protein [Rickettsiaceae bacterium]|nr:DUF2282 domain-containing protein [Rickettsiaceae bacterium]
MKKIKNKKSAILATTLTSLFLSVGSATAAGDKPIHCEVFHKNAKGEIVASVAAHKNDCGGKTSDGQKHSCAGYSDGDNPNAWIGLPDAKCEELNKAIKAAVMGEKVELSDEQLKEVAEKKLKISDDVKKNLGLDIKK